MFHFSFFIFSLVSSRKFLTQIHIHCDNTIQTTINNAFNVFPCCPNILKVSVKIPFPFSCFLPLCFPSLPFTLFPSSPSLYSQLPYSSFPSPLHTHHASQGLFGGQSLKQWHSVHCNLPLHPSLSLVFAFLSFLYKLLKIVSCYLLLLFLFF